MVITVEIICTLGEFTVILLKSVALLSAKKKEHRLNFEQARHNMICHQLRTWGVLDSQILDLIATIPRENYVPEAYQSLAYADTDIPIGFEQVMLPPKTIARMLQALKISPEESILEIGTGLGYLTTLLCNLGKYVYSLDILPELANQARSKLQAYGNHKLELICQDGFQYCQTTEHRFDVIVITGSMPKIYECFSRQLNIGGRLFAIVGDKPVMSATLIEKLGKDHWSQQSLFELTAPRLLQIPERQSFIF